MGSQVVQCHNKVQCQQDQSLAQCKVVPCQPQAQALHYMDLVLGLCKAQWVDLWCLLRVLWQTKEGCPHLAQDKCTQCQAIVPCRAKALCQAIVPCLTKDQWEWAIQATCPTKDLWETKGLWVTRGQCQIKGQWVIKGKCQDRALCKVTATCPTRGRCKEDTWVDLVKWWTKACQTRWVVLWEIKVWCQIKDRCSQDKDRCPIKGQWDKDQCRIKHPWTKACPTKDPCQTKELCPTKVQCPIRVLWWAIRALCLTKVECLIKVACLTKVVQVQEWAEHNKEGRIILAVVILITTVCFKG